jgi:acyl-CoA dehydrogenase
MDADLQLYRDQVRRFIQAEVVPHQKIWAAQLYVDRSAWKRAGDLGLLLADIPQEYGGGGGTFAHMAILWEELMAVGEVGFGTHVHAVVAQYITKYGTEEQRLNYLPRMANAELVGAFAATEPDAGSDLQGIRTRAQRIGESYIVNGSKVFITNGYVSDLLLLVAKTDPDAGARGISLFLIETADLPGFRRGPILDMIGRKGHDVCELFFDQMEIPASALLGNVEGKGLAQLMKELPYERTFLGLFAVAAMERALALTLDHVRQRKVFGKPLFDMQNTRFKLAEARTKVLVARVFIDWCIGQMLDGTMETDIASMAKWYLSDMQCNVIDECLQLFGGYGYMMEYPIAQMYADARVQKIYGGTNEIMKEIIAYSL